MKPQVTQPTAEIRLSRGIRSGSLGSALSGLVRADWFLSLFAASCLLVVYTLTLTRTVGLIDSGELATGCYRLNILHPTGYPLYTVLGRLISLLPFGTVITRVALLSAVLAASGAGIVVALCRRVGAGPVSAVVTGLVIGLSLPVWGNANDAEVYALSFLLLALLWLAVSSASLRTAPAIVGYLAGLALANHMMAVMTLLGLVAVVVWHRRKVSGRALLVFAVFFVVGTSVYLFLSLRARAGPLFPWGDPKTLERFVWHVTGRQYQVWMFSASLPEVLRNVLSGIQIIGRSFVWVLLPVAGFGWLLLGRRNPALTAGVTLTVVLTLVYAANYNIPDIDAYYIPALVALTIPTAVGLDWFERRIGRLAVLLLTLAVLPAALNWRWVDRSDDRVAYQYALVTLASAAPNATIITDWWDLYSPVMYLQQVEGLRPDVCIVDKELLRRSWYLRRLERTWPWLAQASADEIAAYRQQLELFEHGRLKETVTIQRCFIALLESFVLRHPDRPAYTTFDADAGIDARQLLTQWSRVPVGLLFALRSDDSFPEFDWTGFRIELPGRSIDRRTLVMLMRYRFFVLRRANGLALAGRFGEADSLVEWYRRQPVAKVAPLPRG